MTHLNELSQLRKEIDEVDHEIINLIHKRFKLVKKISIIKQKLKTTNFQPKRLEEIKKERITFSKKTLLSKDFIIKLVELLHNESLNLH